ncbi:hypothetical protein CVT25_010234 [Psilocybe cyanescens]|uniref:Peroxisomal membrane protein PEX14 n=1 Tax=Psilocybe cyanescens TaxID=93625 RepID=A0A409XCX9_PSICY|nr:hypothetical protein CVT25_010234 [Psilocybe cyanescens]
MSTPDRQELINNAVVFLADPKTQASPVTQRIQFLEAKGLSPQEIDIAMKQAAFASPSRVPYANSYAPNPYTVASVQRQRWDWRDYFITAVVSGTVTYGAVSLFQKYLLPHLQPPTSTAYEEDRDALTAQFDAAEALLKEIQSETAAVRAAVEEQKERIDQTTEDVKSVVVELRDGETKTRDEMREIREEVTNIREMLPKMIEKNKESQNQSLAELQQELKSLKALLLSRAPTVSSTPASPLPLLGRPSIPAWQLAASPQPSGTESSISTSTSSTASLFTSNANGKGKEVESRTMFSQLRSAVEQLAQQPIRVLDASSPESTPGEHPASRSQSLDIQATRSTSPLSSTQLAESALSSLRKSLVSQRSGTGASTPSPKASSPEPARVHKSNLEERLRRATFAIGDASGSSTPQRSSRVASPSPMGRNRKPEPEQSAASTPPAGSPAVTPAVETDKQLTQLVDGSLEEKDASIAQPPSDVEEVSTQSKPSSIDQPAAAETPPLTDLPPATNFNVPEASNDPLGITKIEQPRTHLQEEKMAAISIETKADTIETNVDDSIPPTPATILTTEGTNPVAEASIENAANLTAAAETKHESTAESISAVEVKREDSVESTRAVETKPITAETTSTGELSPTGTGELTPEVKADLGTAESAPATSVAPSEVESPSEIATSSPQTESNDSIPTESLNEEIVAAESLPELPTTPLVVDRSAEVESLQARLVLIEQRFLDVSASFKRLQAEKLAADAVLKESSPLESINDANALLQAARFEEVREMHKLETHSLTDEAKKVRTQLDETEALFQAAQRATTHAEEAVDKQKDDFARLQKEVESAKNIAKEEEEKRVKAISLLKTVRQKLVKAEKDKEDALREISVIKEKEKNEKNKEQIDRLNFQQELETVHAAHDEAIANLKAQFSRDMASTKERYEQEISALRGQFELDLASSKASHAKELGAKSSQITTLENSLNNVTRDKNAFFDQLQLRQAELESAQAHLESLQHQNTEFQFQLRESTDRLSLLKEEYSELFREHDSRSRDPVTSADEVARMVSATEAKYEAKLAEMKRNIAILEKERAEGEADWSKKLKEKVKDLDDVKRILGSAAKNREADENAVAGLKADLAQAKETTQKLQRQVIELPLLHEQIQELQKASKEQEEEINVKVLVLEKQIEESKSREMQLKQANKTLREELRKVQSSAALLERQRNPGVGYWTTRVSESGGSSENRRPSVSTPPPETPSRVSSPTPSTATSNKNEEEVNLEYLRNVILQFLEHKEMRPNLVKVLSIILRFTPQETRRMIAKV